MNWYTILYPVWSYLYSIGLSVGHKCKYVAWSRGITWMLLILFLSYRLKERTHSYVLHCFETYGIVFCISATSDCHWVWIKLCVAFQMDKYFFFSKKSNWGLLTCDSLPLTMPLMYSHTVSCIVEYWSTLGSIGPRWCAKMLK